MELIFFKKADNAKFCKQGYFFISLFKIDKKSAEAFFESLLHLHTA